MRKAKTIGRNRPMGNVTHHGWYKPSDEIPQPISILLGSNLRKNSEQASKPQKWGAAAGAAAKIAPQHFKIINTLAAPR
jgi:hypothetical protein